MHMNIFLTIRVAFWALGKNKLRAGLTMLGIIIGIASVTTMVSLGGSASELIQSQLQSLGTNVVVVMPGTRRGGGGVRDTTAPTLTAKDSDAIAKECPAVLASSPLVGASGQLIYGNSNWKPRDMFGVGPDYLVVRNWPVQAGGFFTQREITSAAKVCVIGQTVANKLFQTTNPLGQVIRVKNIPCRVVGVLERKGANMIGDDQDDIIVLPYTTVRKRLQGSSFDNVNAIMVSARTQAQMSDAEGQVRRLLLERHRIHPGEPADFNVQNTTEIANTMGAITGAMTLMLSAIAAISLVVGGVGIMNIMLVSVTERTREIGIRMAVGAKSRDILRQFLVEAIILAGIGGAIGVLVGVGASVGLTALINSLTKGSEWPTVVSLPAAGVAMLFAGAVGLFFGYYPARRASRLDPIESLRFE
jgi:putative ABC transport system permease protein